MDEVSTLEVLCPTVAPSPGLLGVWELTAGGHELFHQKTWTPVVDVQAVPNGGAPTRQVWLRLAGGKTLLRPVRALLLARPITQPIDSGTPVPALQES